MHTPALDFSPASAFAAADLARFVNEVFADYVVPMQMNEGFLWDLARKEGVDAHASLVASHAEKPVAFGLIARRGWSARLAAFGVLPAERRHGVGRALMQRLLADARARGDRRFELECIDQNPAAIAFYRTLGFRQTGRLLAYSGRPVTVPSPEPLIEIDPHEVARAVALHGDPELPWQLWPETLAHATLPARAYQLGPARALVSIPDTDPAWLRVLVVETTRRRQGWGRRLFSALGALHPGRDWNVPALYPESIPAAFFVSCGLPPAPISQSRFELRLAQP